ncbi:OB-fold domain-containing protein [Nocardioides sp. QY071]|nr:OB-fold domain-containing protein [Nocardioides sp. QY071]WGY01656.1 OB-fold domain-containing protein [Nocardioides sp. QY071]
MTEYFPGGLPTPRPVVEPDTRPWWDAAERGALTVPHCGACDRSFWYPRGFCPRCGSGDIAWLPATGHGEVYSYSIVRRAAEPWGSHVPFVLAYVTLDEGVTVQANVVGCASDALVPGLRVRAVFERTADDDLPILRFTPANETS